ncbi:MAG TPA: cytochrome c3 family protein [Longimicrobiales bacterium]|nr:cytochrome c3 family protein [Longimicrobiales bacterium]
MRQTNPIDSDSRRFDRCLAPCGHWPGATALLFLVVSACTPTPERWSRAQAEGHGPLACADCHQGDVADRGVAAVPSRSCNRRACHGRDADEEVAFGVVSLSHKAHGTTDGPALECAACHIHGPAETALEVPVGTCALCHLEEMSGAGSADCATCHGVLQHDGETSQGVPVSHATLPWIGGRCVRCHYDVSPPDNAVQRVRCLTCHEETPPSDSSSSELHQEHPQLNCTACHLPEAHSVRAMSTAIDLVCSDCHAEPHATGAPAMGRIGLCDGCHQDAHSDQQRMFLGLVADDVMPVPSEKFLMGLTCRSCHAHEDGLEARRSAAAGASCTGCHESPYSSVLAWWEDGVELRVRNVRSFIAAAERLSAPADPDLARAGALLDFIDRGRGVHNLTLTHRLLQRAVGLTAGVTAALGAQSLPTPPLGIAPDADLCSNCHYNLRFDAARSPLGMRDAFHRSVLEP